MKEQTGRAHTLMTATTLEQNPADEGVAGGDVSRDVPLSTVLVGIPCYNEEVAIGSLVLRAFRHAGKVVVLDDGSTDKTAEVARLAGADVLVHDVNLGKGAALRDIFKYALQRDVDIVVILDGDGQHNPDDIPKLVKPLLLDEADIVNGSRYLNSENRSTPRYRRFGQLFLDKFTRLGLSGDVAVTDTQSGFRAFSTKTIPYFKFTTNELAIDSEMLLDAANAKLRIKEVDVGVRYDVGRSSKHPVSHGFQVMMGVLRNIEFKRPLTVFTAPGLMLIFIGAGLGVYVYEMYLTIGHVPNGPAILTLLFTLVGTFMAFTGIILHSVAALIESTSR
jgi:glycosyltransferase involved in cell wall biosynthesis